MKKYRLKKDLPTFKAGEEFAIPKCGGGLWKIDGLDKRGEWYGHTRAYSKQTLEEFPDILTDWFEEIPEQPKTVWDLKGGDIYYQTTKSGDMCKYRWEDDEYDIKSRKVGNVFLTKKAAEQELARRKAKVILERDTKGFKPDWRKPGQLKYYVGYSYKQNDFYIGEILSSCGLHLHFATRSDAKASIDAHPNEWKTYIGVEE